LHGDDPAACGERSEAVDGGRGISISTVERTDLGGLLGACEPLWCNDGADEAGNAVWAINGAKVSHGVGSAIRQ